VKNITLLIVPIGVIEFTRKQCENVTNGIYFAEENTAVNKKETVKH